MDLMGWNWLLTLMPPNSQWKSQRRHFRQEFDGGAIKKHLPTVINSTHNLLKHLLETPDRWNEHFHHMTAETIMGITYGIEVLSAHDSYIETAEAAVEAGSQAMASGAYLVNVFPILKHVPAWMPGAGFQNEAKRWKKHLDEIFEAPFAAVKASMVNGTAKSCFTVQLLQAAEASVHDTLGSDEHTIQSAAAAMYIYSLYANLSHISQLVLTRRVTCRKRSCAISDMLAQTRGFLENFMLAMVLHPEVQKAAQAELDTVLGSDRLPTLADQDSLPYMAVVIRESWRWEIVLPLALPHMLTVDDEYKGYFIPKGAIVFPNSYSVMNDEIAYPQPTTFRPERFLKNGIINESVRNPTGASFGPGRSLAEPAVWLTAACILTLFDISKVVGRDGTPIEPSGRFRPGFLR
ncbi:hypothetical protein HWV62_4257 [Athelia sp. TMB]|nr:hypothetical protein HWV62_4257 [Athelia sp. TMB]